MNPKEIGRLSELNKQIGQYSYLEGCSIENRLKLVDILEEALDLAVDFATTTDKPYRQQMIDGDVHVCGASGFGVGYGDICPACEKNRI